MVKYISVIVVRSYFQFVWTCGPYVQMEEMWDRFGLGEFKPWPFNLWKRWFFFTCEFIQICLCSDLAFPWRVFLGSTEGRESTTWNIFIWPQPARDRSTKFTTSTTICNDYISYIAAENKLHQRWATARLELGNLWLQSSALSFYSRSRWRMGTFIFMKVSTVFSTRQLHQQCST
jgi:hypothetical protein